MAEKTAKQIISKEIMGNVDLTMKMFADAHEAQLQAAMAWETAKLQLKCDTEGTHDFEIINCDIRITEKCKNCGWEHSV